jgi:hypothetical protein
MQTVSSVVAVAVVACVTLATMPAAVATPASLPERLTHQEYWQLSSELSEEDTAFISDNLVSNEMSFAQVIPEVVTWGVREGVYLGVGPEQNFTYLEAMRARIGFIIDIRRDNLLLHLVYKALFELSPNRAAFVSHLFSRPDFRPSDTRTTADELMEALARAPKGSAAEHQKVVTEVLRTLERYQFPLTGDDLSKMKGMLNAFHEYGPDITYSTTLLKRPFGTGSFANLMKQRSGQGQPLGFLASESAYRFVRDLQSKNLVIPVTGNFAGTKTLRSIGDYLRKHNATVSAFYVSNVEDYLGRERSIPRNGDWRTFCENVASLPLDPRSVFIRPWGLAAFDSTGHLRLSKDMHVASNEAAVHPPGAQVTLPRALSAIDSDIGRCKWG